MRKIDAAIVNSVKSAMLSMQRFQWEQGCAAQALLEYEGPSDLLVQICMSAVMRASDDGRVGIMDKNESVADPAALGEALLLSGKTTGQTDLIEAADKLYAYLKKHAPRTKDGILCHFDTKNEVWVDAYYMVPPFLCKYGDVEEAMTQIKGMRAYLMDEDAGLLSHTWDDTAGRIGRNDFWGVGNGWAMAGMTRVIGMLSENNMVFQEYLIEYVRKLIDGCIPWQREDGLFHNVIDQSSSFVETNLGQMMAYTIYRGVCGGYLDPQYLRYANLAREAAYRKVDRYGFVRGVCGAPTFDQPGIAPEGQAFFILMEAACRDLYAVLSDLTYELQDRS